MLYDELDFKVIDSHIHIMGGIENIEYLIDQKNKYGYEKVNILSIDPMGDLSQNAKCLVFKIKSKGDFAFAGLRHTGDKSFSDQALQAYEMGFDGFKMIEGKPGIRKLTGLALNSIEYDPFYSFLCKKNLPLVLHAADPKSMWDDQMASDFAKQQGWVYTKEGYSTKEEIENEVYNVLEKHDGIKLILAHFFFASDDLERAGRLLDKYPNLKLDITPGVEMFTDFKKDINSTKQFFVKYQKQIIFGTDNFDVTSKRDEDDKDVINSILYKFLCAGNEFSAWDLELEGIGLDNYALKNILRENFLHLVGRPSEVDCEYAGKYCREMLGSGLIKNPDNEKDLLKAIEIFKTE